VNAQSQLAGIGERVVSAREAMGWTQTELASRAGFTDNTIRKVERGVRVGPGTLRKVLDTVGIQPEIHAVEQAGFPRNVQAMLDLLGMYLMRLPEDEQPVVMQEISRYLMERPSSTERTITGQ